MTLSFFVVAINAFPIFIINKHTSHNILASAIILENFNQFDEVFKKLFSICGVISVII